jgi:hypothetical protein
MIAKVQPSKRESGSSFKRLLNYLTKGINPETGETLLGEKLLCASVGVWLSLQLTCGFLVMLYLTAYVYVFGRRCANRQ